MRIRVAFAASQRLRLLAAMLTATTAIHVAAALRADDHRPRASRHRAEVIAACTIPATILAAESGTEPAVMLGGLSDLCIERIDERSWRAWAVTDRGPNGVVRVDGTERRTLAAPSFAPRIVEFVIAWDKHHPEHATATVMGTILLRNRDGEPLSGRPNGVANDPRMVDPSGALAIAADPDGVDTEGLVRLRTGAWWLAEEYRPSLLAASADGAVGQRHVPRGQVLEGAGMQVEDSLPGPYAERRDNRGFEALAIAPDESRIFALVQSPLARPDRNTAIRNGNVRLLSFDPATGAAAEEHVYRVGAPTKQKAHHGDETADVKLCAMAAIGPRSLLVLEQAAGGMAALFLVDLAAATDTLPRTWAGDDPPLESLADPAAAGIEPVTKTLLADLGPALGRMRSQAGIRDGGGLKIEGLAVADERHVFLVNDDDFGLREDGSPPQARSCLWIVKLPAPLPLTPP